MKNNRYTLRALARLLAYPDVDLRAQLDPLMAAIDAEAALSPSRRAELRALAADLLRRDPIEVESRYVETFDRGRSTSLHLFEHVHGDSRDRGPAMIDLRQTYERAGLDLASGELPDHLGVVLEFASTQPASVAKGFLAELGHIVNAIFSALMQKKSPYAAVMAAVLDLAGMPARAVEIEPEETLDESWAEPVAFDGCSTRGQARPGDPQPVHLVRKASTQGVMA
ncbi:nitrate reductase molybdenum cofactor assembly chaperone [Tibeticola sp.]|jgi:nitrate reductase delta subunit|uniref:nitrate reductase molybdenum cofactor assembly chaperone n=1 Tax=Tibeticola sp. TaxID=2005368 RepID=UPI00258A7BAD|nr:nitrate reductase molybdenum cofactor assembly chaperone [Tibeticola sp.]MCI4440672.1 nitrate reductase molybdenum cofactor assembly chaperone [Tibeticola sp.]